MPTTYEALIDRVSRPARYTGGELHSIVKEWDAPAAPGGSHGRGAPEVRVALAYPDLYDLGMSNLGLGILYDIVNRRPDALAERVFSPWADMEELLRAHGEPLRSLETRHALHEFDLLGISLSYEQCFTNVLNMLDLGGIAVRTADRADDETIVLGGGSAALEPEPMAPFFDALRPRRGRRADRRARRLRPRLEAPRRRSAPRAAQSPGVHPGGVRALALRGQLQAGRHARGDAPDRRGRAGACHSPRDAGAATAADEADRAVHGGRPRPCGDRESSAAAPRVAASARPA